MNKVHFHIRIEPFGKQRPRAVKRGNFIQIYTPKETVVYEEALRTAFKSELKEFPVFKKGEPLKATMEFAFTVPKSYTKKLTAKCINGEHAHTVKPDVDNCVKAVMDAANKIIWDDDNSVKQIIASKCWAKDEPYVDVIVERSKDNGKDNITKD